MQIPDLSATLYYSGIKSKDGLPIYSVGWLGDSVPRNGEDSREALRRLAYFAETNTQEKMFGGCFGAWGYHTCEICGSYKEYGEIIVTTSQAHYFLPRMVFHYIQSHHYCPPDQFLAELLEAEIEPTAYGPLPLPLPPTILPFSPTIRDEESRPESKSQDA